MTDALYLPGPMNGAQVRAARSLLGWSQTRLCEEAGISRATLNDIENEKGDPRRSSMEAVRTAFSSHGIRFSEDAESISVHMQKPPKTRRKPMWA